MPKVKIYLFSAKYKQRIENVLVNHDNKHHYKIKAEN